jgi:uncharacterized protein YjaZ
MDKMIFRLATFFSTLLFLLLGQGTNAQINLHTEDLPRFYEALDSVLTTPDSIKQIEFINELYVDKASKGLKEFMVLRGGNVIDWKKLMLTEKQSLIEKRPWILSVLKQQSLIEKKLNRFQKLYPEFRVGDIYFCVGINNSGGTIQDKTVYIGTEVIASNKKNWAVSIVLHEFTHTQQWTQRNINQLKSSESFAKEYLSTHTQLLGKCLEEGMADFVSELVNGESLAKTNPLGHTAFGLKNEAEIWDIFKKEMLLTFDSNMGWLYGVKREINGEKINDLGYFVGHQICKSYYNNAKNKKQALKEMLELDLTDENARNFLIASGYDMKYKPEKIK